MRRRPTCMPALNQPCVTLRRSPFGAETERPVPEPAQFLFPIVADAILDRVANTSHHIQLAGETTRKLGPAPST